MEWAKDMHKFQRGYLIGLLGGSYEEIPEVYRERSSITHVDNIDTPLLVSLIPPCSCCGDPDSEVDRGLCRSSTERTIRSFCRPKQNVFTTHWRNNPSKSSLFSSNMKGTGRGSLKNPRKDKEKERVDNQRGRKLTTSR